MIRGYCTADWHDSPEFHGQVKPAVDYFVQRVVEDRPDFVSLPGDFFVKRGHINPLETMYVRTAVYRIAAVCPVWIMPGNHDEVQSVLGVDSVSGVFSTEDNPSIHPNIHVITRPTTTVHTIPNPNNPKFTGTHLQVMALPYPSRAIWMAGKDVGAEEAHHMMGELTTQAIRELARSVGPGLPSVFMFHGSIEGGLAGPEVLMTSEMETVVRQGSLPPEATVCIGGHLHIPHRTGRFLYTGAPCSHTFSTERLEPSFLEIRLYDPSDAPFWGEDPNDGWDTQSTWKARYMRHPIPVALPLWTLDLRNEVADNPVGMAIANLEAQAAKVRGARMRIKLAVPQSLRHLIDDGAVHRAAMTLGAESARVLVETRPEITVRADEVHAGITVDRGLELWLQFKEQYGVYADEIKAMAKEIDAMLTPEERHETEPVDYRWLRMGWSNWKQYGPDNTVDFTLLPGITAVVGPNMAGKSNLAELPAFLGWGVLRSSLSERGSGRSKLSHAVRLGDKQCTAWGEFESRGEVYRVERSVTLQGKSQKGTLVLSQRNGHDWIGVSGVDARETQRILNGVLGSLEHYLATSLSSQFDLDRIFNMGDAEFQTTLQEACNTRIWDVRFEYVKRLSAKIETELTIAREAVARLHAEAMDLDNATARLQESRDAATQADAALKVVTTEESVTRNALEEAKRRVDGLAVKREALRKLREAVQTARDATKAADERLNAASAAVSRTAELVRAAEGAEKEMGTVQGQIRLLEQAEAEHKTIVAKKLKVDTLAKAAQQKRADAAQATNLRLGDQVVWNVQNGNLALDVQVHKSLVSAETQAWQSRIQNLKERASGITKRAIVREQVRNCNPHDRDDPTLNEKCPFLADSFRACEEGDKLLDEISALEQTKPSSLMDAEAKLVGVEKKLADHLAAPVKTEPSELEKQLLNEATQIEAEIKQAGYSSEEMARVNSDLETLMRLKPRETMARLAESRKLLDERKIMLADADHARQTRSLELEGVKLAESHMAERYRTDTDALAIEEAQVTPALNLANQTHAQAQIAVKLATTKVTEAAKAVGMAEAAVEKAQKATVERERVVEQTKTIERRLSVAAIMREACSRTGIPYLILEKALPLFEQECNAYLEGTELQIRVTSQGDDGIERGFLDDMGWHPISEASGFVASVLGLTMRWSLAVVASTFTGTRIHQFTQDEGFGPFDQKNLMVAQRMLRSMVERAGVEHLIVISHVPAIVEAADHVITVCRDPEGSYLSGPGVSKGAPQVAEAVVA